jgi:translation initiation factor IF-2
VVDIDTMEVVALDLGLEPTRSSRRAPKSLSEENRELLLQRRADDETYDLNRAAAEAHLTMPLRPPVVCLMGHVDHGKTTLMDALRRRRKRGATGSVAKKKKMKNKGEASKNVSDGVAGTEAGGITQAISAFQVPLENQENGAVTFLDTPGHAAFRSMRESGSHAADVIVLVVAADDGVSPQTIEIIEFFKSIYKETGGISLVVAMTKIDKPGIIIDESRYRIENELMEQGIVPESFASTTKGEFGPPVQIVPVSGLTGEGVDNLIEALVLQSEVMELRADPDAQAEGIILDARFEKGVGVVADCIIRWGSMHRGDIVLSGLHTGKVKALKDSEFAFIYLFTTNRKSNFLHLISLFLLRSLRWNSQESVAFRTSQNSWI